MAENISGDNWDEEELMHDYDPEAVVSGTYFTPNNVFGSSLHKSIASNDINGVKNLIHEGCELNLNDSRGYTGLHIAVEHKSFDILKILLEQSNLRYNVRNHFGETPLFLSLKHKCDDEIVTLFIDHGCDITIGNNEEVTPLHIAVKRETNNVAHKLILKGADINSTDRDGYTPLHEAVTKNRFENVCLLLYYNASVNEKSIYRLATPFLIACNDSSGCSTDIAEHLLNYVDDLNDTDDYGKTALELALCCQMDIAMDIIERGANVNFASETPSIHYSLFYETSEVFKAIWPQIDWKMMLNLNYHILQSFIYQCKFSDNEFLECCNMIFESPFIEDIINKHQSKCPETLFSYIAYRNTLDVRIKLCYLLLSYGVTVYFHDICSLYQMFGFEKTIEVILSTGCCIELKHNPHHNYYSLLVSRICYNNADIYSCHSFTEYSLQVRRKPYTLFYPTSESSVLQYYNKTPKSLENVCPLLQLCRDAVRDIFYKTYDRPFAFKVYSEFMSLNVPTNIKEILFLRRPLYPEVL